MKLSVVTPSFNQGRFIERTLRSIADQDGVAIEHIVFDGGSIDETRAILERFEPPVRWVSEPDRGQAHAVNKAILASSGDIIGWLNSDDVYYPGAAASVMAFFEAHPDVDVLYGMADHIDPDDVPFETYPSEPWDVHRLRNICYLCQPAVFLRRRVVEQHGLLDESLAYCMDYEYWLRLGKAGVRFAYLERKLAGSRLYPQNKTLGSRVAVHREINDMQKALFGRVPDPWLFNYAYALVEQDTIRAAAPARFARRFFWHALRSAIHWNGTVTASMIGTMLVAVRASLPRRAKAPHEVGRDEAN